MSQQMPLFDAVESELRKEEGMARAASPERRKRLLKWAKAVALEIASEKGRVSALDVAKWFDEKENINLSVILGNGMGSLFRGTGLVWSGRMEKNTRDVSHSRLVMVWEYPQ